MKEMEHRKKYCRQAIFIVKWPMLSLHFRTALSIEALRKTFRGILRIFVPEDYYCELYIPEPHYVSLLLLYKRIWLQLV